MNYGLKYQCRLCEHIVGPRGSDTPEGFVRHMRKEHAIIISVSEIQLMELKADDAIERNTRKRQPRKHA